MLEILMGIKLWSLDSAPAASRRRFPKLAATIDSPGGSG